MSTRPLMVTFGLGAGAAGACARAGAATPTRTISSTTATARFLLIYRLLSSGVKHGTQRDATARNLDGWMDVYSGRRPVMPGPGRLPPPRRNSRQIHRRLGTTGRKSAPLVQR